MSRLIVRVKPCLTLFVSLSLLLVVGGCGGQKVAAPVDPQQARATLEAVLTDWQAGGNPDAWQQKSPKVIVQDLEWSAGAKLVSYQIQGAGESLDANLYCQVQIVTSHGGQTSAPRVVTYVVGTDPVLTVFRDMFK